MLTRSCAGRRRCRAVPLVLVAAVPVVAAGTTSALNGFRAVPGGVFSGATGVAGAAADGRRRRRRLTALAAARRRPSGLSRPRAGRSTPGRRPATRASAATAEQQQPLPLPAGTSASAARAPPERPAARCRCALRVDDAHESFPSVRRAGSGGRAVVPGARSTLVADGGRLEDEDLAGDASSQTVPFAGAAGPELPPLRAGALPIEIRLWTRKARRMLGLQLLQEELVLGVAPLDDDRHRDRDRPGRCRPVRRAVPVVGCRPARLGRSGRDR